MSYNTHTPGEQRGVQRQTSVRLAISPSSSVWGILRESVCKAEGLPVFLYSSVISGGLGSKELGGQGAQHSPSASPGLHSAVQCVPKFAAWEFRNCWADMQPLLCCHLGLQKLFVLSPLLFSHSCFFSFFPLYASPFLTSPRLIFLLSLLPSFHFPLSFSQ